jgi:2-desacetyl-2-hydroxyethyl bacteriochlorophyllide A dehydrogenase
MQALICNSPGNLAYENIPAPILKPGHAIIKIRRIGICGTDLHAYEGIQPFFTYPRILGHELSADLIEADGAEGFVPGQILTCIPYLNCGTCIACKNGKPNCCTELKVIGVHIDGGMSTYLSLPTSSLVKHAGLGYDELALVEPLAIGAHSVSRANVQKDEFVLVIGAGPIGLATMEFARIAGARVIALDINPFRLTFCKENMNVDYCIDARKEDTLARLKKITIGDMPTVVIDATGNLNAINNALQYVAHGGRLILIGLQKEAFSFSHPEFHKRETTLMSSRNATRKDFEHVIKSIITGKIDPGKFITHRVKFNEIKDTFPSWLKPENNVIKAIVELD